MRTCRTPDHGYTHRTIAGKLYPLPVQQQVFRIDTPPPLFYISRHVRRQVRVGSVQRTCRHHRRAGPCLCRLPSKTVFGMAKIQGYKLIKKIGEGGMATVYKAVQTSLNRPVAVKVLAGGLLDHPEARERFERESLIIARINHPNIIHVIDRGITPEGMPYFVMEHVEGIDLAGAIHSGTLDFTHKLEICVQICKALAYAHRNGVVHRDLKPGNVVLEDGEHVRMLDFGIARFYEDGPAEAEQTRTGMVMGTLPYMSPEQQVCAGDVTTLSDIYSLGVLMYELFTGSKPLGRFSLPTELDSSLPEALERIVMQCLEQSPEKRPASADAIKDELLKLLRGAHLQAAQRARAGRGLTRIEDRFELLDVIKEDRHGAVYLYEEKTARSLMVIRKRPRAGSGYTEARMLAALRHPHITDILGASRNDQYFIIVMEYLSGGSLADRLVTPCPVHGFLTVAREICDGLSFAHTNRIIHGNLRPSNILFTREGHAKLVDFGLNEHYGPQQGGDNWYNHYREPKSIAADIFAGGVIFYQMLTGSLPPCVTGQRTHAARFEDLPAHLQELVAGMLARAPAMRPASFDAVLSQCDSMLAARVEGAPGAQTTLAATQFLDPATRTGVSGAVSSGARRWRRIRPMVLLGLLALTGVNYVIHAGGLEAALHDLTALWETICAAGLAFYAEHILPLLVKYRDALTALVEERLRPALENILQQLRH